MKRGVWFFIICLMSAYVLYEHSVSDCAITPKEQIVRHQRMLAGNSEYFNPWQYRILSTVILEGTIRASLFLLPFLPPIVSYFFLHFAQTVLLLYLCLFYFQRLEIKNPFLLAAGLTIICFCIANSSFRSDFSYNTYFDVIFYLTAALLIIGQRDYWIIPLTFFAALNRETSGFIPLMLIMPFPLREWKSISKRRLLVTGLSLAVFASVFFAVRAYYGYRSYVGVHGLKSVSDFLVFNFTFFRTYPLLLGTLSVVPILFIMNLTKMPNLLQGWFWLIVPFWFLLHFTQSNAMESRLFLVPHILIFMPGFLLTIEQWYVHSYSPERKE